MAQHSHLTAPARVRDRVAVGLVTALVVGTLSACMPDGPAPMAPATTPAARDTPTASIGASGPPVEAQTTPASPASPASPDELALQGAREDLADPVTDLAESTLDVARRVDFIRHEVDRGPAMRQAVADVAVLLEALVDDAAAVEQMVADMDGALQPTRGAVEALATFSRAVRADVAAEIAALQPILDVDERLAAVVQGWDDPASRSQVSEHFAALMAEAETVRSEAHALALPSDGCTGPRDNRIRWAELVVQRTTQLRDAALAADGPAFDQLSAAFAEQPYGEDRVVADAATRDCWLQHTSLPDVAEVVEEHLAAVEEALVSQ